MNGGFAVLVRNIRYVRRYPGWKCCRQRTRPAAGQYPAIIGIAGDGDQAGSGIGNLIGQGHGHRPGRGIPYVCNGIWRVSRGVYRFTPEIYNALVPGLLTTPLPRYTSFPGMAISPVYAELATPRRNQA